MPAGGMTAVPQEDADSSSWTFLVTTFDGAAELLGGDELDHFGRRTVPLDTR